MTTYVNLSASELGMLWTTYIEDTANLCLITYFLKTVEDKEIEVVLNEAKRCCETHITRISQLFIQEQIPVPHGFGEQDLVHDAPRLFSDSFILRYLKHLSVAGMATYSLAKGVSIRQDVKALFSTLYQDASQLQDMSVNLLVHKGIPIRPPVIIYPKQIDYVQKESFLSGIIGRQRPLSAIEIAHIGINLEKNNIGKQLLLGFAQVAQTPVIKHYLERGTDIAQKIMNILNQILTEENLPNPDSSDYAVTGSTAPPFSDKLMLFVTNSLSAIGMGNIGLALSASFRRDLAGHYTRLFTEAALYAEDGIELMIANGWFEQPPQNIDHLALLKNRD